MSTKQSTDPAKARAPTAANFKAATAATAPSPSGTKRRRVRSSEAVAEPALDRGMLPALLGYQLRLAQLTVFRDFARSLADFALSPGRVGILVLIEANPGISQSRLAEAVGLDRSTMVPVIDGFERIGLVQRRAGKDRRTNGLWLTREGTRRLTQMKERVRRHEANVTRGLSASERRTLSTLLAKLLAAQS